MAEVLAPIVQQAGSITMLHTSSDAFQNTSSSKSHQPTRGPQMPRGHIYNQSGGTGHRGTSAAPVAPYAFQSTPQLRQESRSSSVPSNSYAQHTQHAGPNTTRQGHVSSSSESTTSSASSSNHSSRGMKSGSRDDMALQRAAVNKSIHEEMLRKQAMDSRQAPALTASTSVPNLPFDVPAKPSPDRYRRANRRTDGSNGTPASAQSQELQPLSRSATPSGSGMVNVAHLYNNNIPKARGSHLRTSSADDTQLPRETSSEQAKRYRRRSVGSFDTSAIQRFASTTPSPFAGSAATPVSSRRPEAQETRSPAPSTRPTSHHERKSSADSLSSSSTQPSSARQDQKQLIGTGHPAQYSSQSSRNDARSTNNTIRGIAETGKRPMNPSPLGMGADTKRPTSSRAKVQAPGEPGSPALSPAAQHLAALSDKDLNKGMKSRLRRVFSFGSAAELRKASAQNNMSAESARVKLEKSQGEHEAEHDTIAAQQEAAGIGAGIYSGQGNFFSGSTDNLSISSTASSASIMLRKMGRGMKKSTRSLKGLFRPKSVIGVPAADSPVAQPSTGQVSMVTVEAEREKVNVNANPHDRVGGGTGYPKLERNSMDAAEAASEISAASNAPASTPENLSRKSIVGGDRERAEVLNAVRKGILKRSGTNSDNSSPAPRPSENGATDTPGSSAPSTPGDDQPRPVNLGGEDYFMGGPRFKNTSTRSLPNTPHGAARNISFSPRIQFHDVWSSAEYDRRGDIATCNRLTPMLAQQIKEELNSFKMEMEVHELSKPHTHFF